MNSTQSSALACTGPLEAWDPVGAIDFHFIVLEEEEEDASLHLFHMYRLGGLDFFWLSETKSDNYRIYML